MHKFLALWDCHWGYEPRHGRLEPYHDRRAIDAVLHFASDFKPDTIILGGDMLDCSAISHHNKGKRHAVEGLRLRRDTEELTRELLDPLAHLAQDRRWVTGNHERWLNDLLEDHPALEGIIEVEALLQLKQRGWKVTPQGGSTRVGKLIFIHGDTVKGGGFPAKKAVLDYDHGSIRLGHYHTHQTFTKTCASDGEARTGIVVPGLCNKNPSYLRSQPNAWLKGFLHGYVAKDGSFNDFVTIISNGKFTAHDKIYKG